MRREGILMHCLEDVENYLLNAGFTVNTNVRYQGAGGNNMNFKKGTHQGNQIDY